MIALDTMLVSTPDVCGGRMRIDGTRITIQRIATLYQQGQDADEIARTYPHLSLGQIDTALTYYHANRTELDAELEAVNAKFDDLKSHNEDSGE